MNRRSLRFARAAKRLRSSSIGGLLVILILSAFTSVGMMACASRRPADMLWEEGRPLPAPEALYDALTRWASRLHSLEGSARLHIHSPERTARFDATVICRRPASIRLEATDFLDHLVFLAIVRDDMLATYSVPDNLFAKSKAAPQQLQAFLGVPLQARELVSLILGSPFFVDLDRPKPDVFLDEGMAFLRVCNAGADVCLRVRMDRHCRPVESILEKGVGGEGPQVRIRAEFEKYKPVGSVDFPFQIRVTDERNGWYSAIQYDEISLNEELPEDLFEFVPPDDAERVVFE